MVERLGKKKKGRREREQREDRECEKRERDKREGDKRELRRQFEEEEHHHLPQLVVQLLKTLQYPSKDTSSRLDLILL